MYIYRTSWLIIIIMAKFSTFNVTLACEMQEI